MIIKRYGDMIFMSLMLLALFLRICALLTFESINNPKTWEYEEIANNILNQKGICFTLLGNQYRNTAMLIYPIVCAALYYFTNHSFLAVKLFQVLISCITCFLVYAIARRIFDKKTGLLALALTSIHPGFIVYSVRLHSLTLEVFLSALSLYLLLFIAEGKGNLKIGLLAGLSLGLSMLTRATVGLFLFSLLLIALLHKKRFSPKVIRPVTGIILGVAIIMTPLIIRNYLVFKRIVILPNETGFHFWIGNSSRSIGTATTLDGQSVFCSAPKELIEEVRGLDEFGQKDMLYADAWNFIRNNPHRFFKLFAKKLFYFWWFTPTQGANYPRSWMMIYRIYYSFIFPFFIIGIAQGLRAPQIQKKRMTALVLLFLSSVSIAQALYYVDGRHRWSYEFMIIILASCGLIFLIHRFNGARAHMQDARKLL